MTWLKNNWHLFVLIIIFLIINNLNYLVGFYQAANSHTTFSALPVVNTGDYYVYLSYIEQGRQGHLFVHNLYNHLNQTRLFFAPHWWLLGQLSALLHLSNVIIYFLARLFLSVLLILMIYQWLKKIFAETKHWWWQLGIILLANGFGVILNPWLIDKTENSATNLWAPETNTFATLTQTPLLIASQVLLLLTFYLFILAWQKKNYLYLLLSALSSGLLALIHPYDAVICGAILLAWSIWIFFKEKNIKLLLYLAILAIPNILVGFYYLWLKSDIVIQQYNQENILASPPLINYLFGFGLVLPLAIGGLIYLFKNKATNDWLKLMIVWAILPWFLVYSPLSFSRRLSNGWQIPLLFISLVFLQYLYKKIRPQWRLVFTITLFIFLSFDTWFYIASSIYILKPFKSVYFLQAERLAVYQQIKQQSKFGDTILSRNNDAGMLPAYTGRKVYLGHTIQTYEFEKKDAEVEKLWQQPQDISDWLKARQIKFIFASHDWLPEFENLHWLAKEKYIETLIDNDQYIFYRVKY